MSISERLFRVREDALAFFFHEMSRLIEALGSASEALRLVADQIPNPAVAAAVRDLHRAVSAGMPLARALELHDGLFGRTRIRLIRAAEEAGDLCGAFDRIAKRIESGSQLARDIRASVAYPILLLNGVLVLWPIGSLISRGWDAYLIRVGMSVALFYGVLALVLVSGGRLIPRLATPDRPIPLPLVGALLRDFRAGDRCWTMGSLYEAGMDLRQVVESVFEPDRGERDSPLSIAMDELRSGSSFSGFVRNAGIFPPATVRVVELGEEAGNLGESLLAESRRLEDQASTALRRLSKGFSRTIYFVAVLAAAWAILSFWSEYFGKISAL